MNMISDPSEKRGPGRPRKPENIIENNIIIFSELNNYEKIKYLISQLNNYLINFRGKYLIIFLIIIIIIIFPIGIFIGRRTFIIDDYMSPQYSYTSKISQLRRSWNKYRALKPYELHIKWLEFLKHYTYVSGGDLLMNQADCLRAWLLFMKAQGANIDVATIPILVSKFQALGQFEYVKLNGQPHTGDIIIFRPIHYPGRGNIPHIGIVEDVKDNYIKYMDFSPLGVGFPVCQKGEWRIQMVVEMNFLIWAGKVMRE